jgi:hypothetical protein
MEDEELDGRLSNPLFLGTLFGRTVTLCRASVETNIFLTGVLPPKVESSTCRLGTVPSWLLAVARDRVWRGQEHWIKQEPKEK